MNPYMLFMAALGIGGGFAVLAAEWIREERRLRRARYRCTVGIFAFGVTAKVCDYRIFGLPGVERGPNWRRERLIHDAESWNVHLRRHRSELSAKLADLRAKMALVGFDSTIDN